MERCDECGFVYDTPRAEIVPALRGFGSRYAELLAGRTGAELRSHVRDGVWSPLEYACHMRDVFAAQADKLRLAASEDDPIFPSMRREERAVEEGYNEQDPSAVLDELTARADVLARMFEALDDDGWVRSGVYGYPAPQTRTVEWIGRHTIHEGVHHIMDIKRQLSSR